MTLTRWNRTVPPADSVLRHALQMEGLAILEWTDSPGTIYPVHTHPFVQVHLVLRGHLRVGMPETNEEIILAPGDRLDLPADTPHWEDVVGSEATTYLAATGNGRSHTDVNYSVQGSPGNGK